MLARRVRARGRATGIELLARALLRPGGVDYVSHRYEGSIASLARRAGVTRSHAEKILRLFEEAGLVTRAKLEQRFDCCPNTRKARWAGFRECARVRRALAAEQGRRRPEACPAHQGGVVVTWLPSTAYELSCGLQDLGTPELRGRLAVRAERSREARERNGRPANHHEARAWNTVPRHVRLGLPRRRRAQEIHSDPCSHLTETGNSLPPTLAFGSRGNSRSDDAPSGPEVFVEAIARTSADAATPATTARREAIGCGAGRARPVPREARDELDIPGIERVCSAWERHGFTPMDDIARAMLVRRVRVDGATLEELELAAEGAAADRWLRSWRCHDARRVVFGNLASLERFAERGAVEQLRRQPRSCPAGEHEPPPPAVVLRAELLRLPLPARELSASEVAAEREWQLAALAASAADELDDGGELVEVPIVRVVALKPEEP